MVSFSFEAAKTLNSLSANATSYEIEAEGPSTSKPSITI